MVVTLAQWRLVKTPAEFYPEPSMAVGDQLLRISEVSHNDLVMQRPAVEKQFSRDAWLTTSSEVLDRYEPMWQKLYELAGLTHEPPYVVTHLTGERVRSWWISSVILCRRGAGVM